ncbi:cupin domain-containing protein [Microtetraspora malaysiensis]|uniref:cupin domain-containing protein n=1 Tax=Microtetraspora malaysiensis TaxID=161358 RepID=UPI003D8CB451
MSIVLPDATTAALGPDAPKPTSVTGDQREAALEVWTTRDGSTVTGVWECTPGTFTALRDGYHEICQILSGRATVTHEDGTSAEVGPGSTLILPDGWRGEWQVHETVRKTYVIVRV